jgi:hypothetical protein
VDEGDRRGVGRLTIQEAARQLGISEGAVRKRVTRGTLEHQKDEDGRVYVYLDAGADDGVDVGADPNSNALISQLRDEVAYLRDENRRKDEIIMQQAMTMRQLSAAPPQEPSEDVETVEEEPDRAEPRYDAESAQEATEDAQQRSGWREPVDKLPRWHYVLGILLVFSAGFLSTLLVDFETPLLVGLLILVVTLWAPPGIFGFWVGYRKRNLRLWSQALPLGALVAAVAALGLELERRLELEPHGIVPGAYFHHLNQLYLMFSPEFMFPPAWLLFVSASLLGNTRQRRRIGRISGTTPASPLSRTTQGAAQHNHVKI